MNVERLGHWQMFLRVSAFTVFDSRQSFPSLFYPFLG